MEPITIESVNQLKDNVELFYKSQGPIFCPALNETVSLTSEGFNHLRYNHSGIARSLKIQRIKYCFLKPGLDILAKATTVQEYRVSINSVGPKAADGFRKTQQVEYWGLVAIQNIVDSSKTRIRIIVRRVGDGKLHFWSVMPNWKQIMVGENGVFKKVGDVNMEDE